jgi:hypothetical protein
MVVIRSNPTAPARDGSPARSLDHLSALGIKLDNPGLTPRDATYLDVAIVGMGGSGKSVVTGMLDRCSGQLPEGIHAIVLDTDPDPGGLPREMFVSLPLPHADFIAKNRDQWPTIAELLPRGYRAGRIIQGSMMKRIVTASVVLPYYRKRVREVIRRRLVQPLLELKPPMSGRSGGQLRVALIIIGSLGGGCGSAMKDEIPALFRDEVRKVNEGIIVYVSWHVFTPNVHRDLLPMEWQVSRSRANARAALLEFEAAYRDPAVLPWDQMGVAPFEAPLVNEVIVYDRANERGAMLPGDRQMYAMVANAILTETIAAINDPQRAHLANFEGDVIAFNHGFAPFGAAVAYTLAYPAAAVRRYGSLVAEGRLLGAALGSKLGDVEVEKAARQILQRSRAANLADLVEEALASGPPEVPLPVSRAERKALPDTVRSQRRQLEDRWLPEFQRRADAAVPEVAGPIQTALCDALDGLLDRPSRCAPHDSAAIARHAVTLLDGIAAHSQAAIANLNRPALAQALDVALSHAREAIEAEGILFGRVASRRAAVEVVNAYDRYAQACRQAARLQAATLVVGRLRPEVEARARKFQAIGEAGRAACAALGPLAEQARERIGRREVFVTEAVDATWAQAQVRRGLAEVDWNDRADAVLGGGVLDRLTGLKAMERFLDGPCAEAVAALLEPMLARYDVFHEEMLVSVREWLRAVAGQIAPQFAFFEPRCGEEAQTYLSHLLAVGSKDKGQHLLEELPNLNAELVETGDSSLVVLTAQRRYVPLEAAFPDLEDLDQHYREWVERTRTKPEAEVHANAAYTRLFGSRPAADAAPMA